MVVVKTGALLNTDAATWGRTQRYMNTGECKIPPGNLLDDTCAPAIGEQLRKPSPVIQSGRLRLQHL